MKFRVISDLHFECMKGKFYNFMDNFLEYQKREYCDVLIIAGNTVSIDCTLYLELFLDKTRKQYDKIIFILGNREYYDHTDNKRIYEIYKDNWINHVQDYYKKLVRNFTNVHLLENDYIEIDNYILFGSTLFSPIDKQTHEYLSDKYFINFDEYNELYKNSKKHLENFIEINQENYKTKIIITHYIPSKNLSDAFRYSKYCSGFCADCDDLMDNKIKYWIYGHSHILNDTFYKNTRFICSPKGYPTENMHRNNDFSLTF